MNAPSTWTVLAIEDDLEVLDIIGTHLRRAGYRVLQATDGESGLALARRGDVDVITLDILMRPLDGVAVLRLLRADPVTSTIPVVLVTVVDGLAGMAADGYVSKPFSGRRLVAEVRRLLEPA